MGAFRTGIIAVLVSMVMCIPPGLLSWWRYAPGNSAAQEAAFPAALAGAQGALAGWVLVAAALFLILAGLRLPWLTLEVISRSTYA